MSADGTLSNVPPNFTGRYFANSADMLGLAQRHKLVRRLPSSADNQTIQRAPADAGRHPAVGQHLSPRHEGEAADHSDSHTIWQGVRLARHVSNVRRSR